MNIIKKIGHRISRSRVKYITLTVIALFCAATIYAAAAYSCTITIDVDGTKNRITTLRTDAYEILNQAGIEIEQNDIVDLSAYIEGVDSVIKVNKAYNIVVYDNLNEGISFRANGTVAQALEQNGIILKDGDELSSDADSNIYEGMEIVISRAFPVMISADGEIVTVNMASGTVSDALDKAVITVDDDDEISASLDTPLKGGMSVKIARVSYTERTAEEDVGFKTVKKNNDKLYTDQSKVETKGVKGKKTVTYKDKYVDGKLTESTAIKTVVTKQPVDEVKIVGTKRRTTSASNAKNSAGVRLANGVRTISTLTPPSSLQLNGNVPTSYKKKLVGTATAYSCGSVTSTGKGVRPGYVAVNPKMIPYHTKMWIVSNDGKYVYGYASAEDTGGFIHLTGSRATICDLYMPSEAQCNRFGRRAVTIYIL